ncbi:MAG: glycoside hydrolase [Phyllobacteriaceae bacterium]|nr:glycoside hydrolase [Phyllobacteriaceae bacterium]
MTTGTEDRTTGSRMPEITTALSAASLAALACFAMLAGLRRVLPAGFLAAGHSERSNHAGAPRQIGGLAAVPAALFAVAVIQGADAWIVLPFLALWLAGLADDHRPLGVALRLGVQVAAAAALVALVRPALPLPDIVPPLAGEAAAVLFLVWTINMVNFMDGLDLMTAAGAGIPLAFCGCLLLVAGGPDDAAVAALAGAGALAGFALHNRPPAKVFLGDSGSLPLGLLAGWALLALAEQAPAAALAPFGYYFADSVWTLLQRLAGGKNILKSHSEHAYQRAFRAGMPVTAIVGRVALCALACGLSGYAATATGGLAAAVIGLAGLGAGVALAAHLRKRANS